MNGVDAELIETAISLLRKTQYIESHEDLEVLAYVTDQLKETSEVLVRKGICLFDVLYYDEYFFVLLGNKYWNISNFKESARVLLWAETNKQVIAKASDNYDDLILLLQTEKATQGIKSKRLETESRAHSSIIPLNIKLIEIANQLVNSLTKTLLGDALELCVLAYDFCPETIDEYQSTVFLLVDLSSTDEGFSGSYYDAYYILTVDKNKSLTMENLDERDLLDLEGLTILSDKYDGIIEQLNHEYSLRESASREDNLQETVNSIPNKKLTNLVQSIWYLQTVKSGNIDKTPRDVDASRGCPPTQKVRP